MKRTYAIWDYFDVWYDEEGMPYVNDKTRVGTVELDTDAMSDEEIIDEMVRLGWINGKRKDEVCLVWTSDMFFELEAGDDGEPLYGLDGRAGNTC